MTLASKPDDVDVSGVAALSAALEQLGVPATAEVVAAAVPRLPVKPGAVPPEALVDYASGAGVQAQVYQRAEFQDLIRHRNAGRPVIALVQGDIPQYVTLLGVDRGADGSVVQVQVRDIHSAADHDWPLEAFLARWRVVHLMGRPATDDPTLMPVLLERLGRRRQTIVVLSRHEDEALPVAPPNWGSEPALLCLAGLYGLLQSAGTLGRGGVLGGLLQLLQATVHLAIGAPAYLLSDFAGRSLAVDGAALSAIGQLKHEWRESLWTIPAMVGGTVAFALGRAVMLVAGALSRFSRRALAPLSAVARRGWASRDARNRLQAERGHDQLTLPAVLARSEPHLRLTLLHQITGGPGLRQLSGLEQSAALAIFEAASPPERLDLASSLSGNTWLLRRFSAEKRAELADLLELESAS